MSAQRSCQQGDDLRLRHVAHSQQISLEHVPGTEQSIIYYKHARFSPDGTTIVAHRIDHALDTYVLPPDLLDSPLSNLQSYSCAASPSSLLSFDVHPAYALTDSSTTWVLSSSVDLPIQMRNALDYSFTSISFPWISSTTEQYHSANSLLYVANGSHFAAGSKGQLALFDTTRPGAKPVVTHTRSKMFYSEGLQDRGLVMSLAESAPTGLLAAGTSTRTVALFDASGLGGPQTNFSLVSAASDPCKGTGVTSLAWSPCGRYFIVGERQSDCAQVFDIRKGGERLARLSGRAAGSTQKFDVDVVQTVAGYEIWSGGEDGRVKMWDNPGTIGGEHLPAADIELVAEPIGAACWHPSGGVLATCSGGLRSNQDHDPGAGDIRQSSKKSESQASSLNIWSVN